MTLADQAAIMLEAIDDGLLQPEDVVRWADTVIMAMEKPPAWVIELSTFGSPHMEDFVTHLREHAQLPPSIRRQVELIVLAYHAGLLSFRGTLPLLFRVTLLERKGRPLDAVGERLANTLVEWDFQEDLDVIAPPLRAKFEAIFRDYLRNAHEISAVIPWRLQRGTDPSDAPSGGTAPRPGNSRDIEGPPSGS